MEQKLARWIRPLKRRAMAAYRKVVVDSGLPGAARNPLLFTAFLVREVWNKDISTKGMALAFQLLFCLVPAMTLVLSLLALLPGLSPERDRVVMFVVDEFLPTDRDMMLAQIEEFIANAEVFSLFGIVVLVYGTVVLVTTLDSTINSIWNIRPRRVSWFQRLGALGMVGILFLGGLLAGVITSEPFQSVLSFLDQAPLVTPGVRSFFTGMAVAWFIFFAMYKLVPSTWVQTGSAAIAAGVAALMFSLAKLGFLIYASWSETYAQIYGVLGTLFMMLLWVYVAWFVVLMGAVLAFVLQNYEHLAGREQRKLLGERYQTYYATRILLAVYRAEQEGRTPIPVSLVAKELGLAAYLTDRLADALADSKLLRQTGSSHWENLEPCRPAAQIDIAQVAIAVARDSLEVPVTDIEPGQAGNELAALLHDTRKTVADSLRQATIETLLDDE